MTSAKGKSSAIGAAQPASRRDVRLSKRSERIESVVHQRQRRFRQLPSVRQMRTRREASERGRGTRTLTKLQDASLSS